MQPVCRLLIDGQAISSLFSSRIKSCQVSDKEGVSSDTITIKLNDNPPAAIPRRGALIRCAMGWLNGSVAYLGTFEVDEVDVTFIPKEMTISGKAAGLRGAEKQQRERHWDDASLADVVRSVASDLGRASHVDAVFEAYRQQWWGQQNISDVHFLEDLAARHGGLFAFKGAGDIVFAKRGGGSSVSGKELSPIIVTPTNLAEGSGRVTFADRSQYKDVEASYDDPGQAMRVDVSAESDQNGTATFRLGDRFHNEAEAQSAADAKAKDLKRQGAKFSCNIIGNPAARGGAPLLFQGCRPGVDGIPFIIETADHLYAKQGYTNALSGGLQVD